MRGCRLGWAVHRFSHGKPLDAVADGLRGDFCELLLVRRVSVAVPSGRSTVDRSSIQIRTNSVQIQSLHTVW
jgi:hypothetical protein